MSAAITGSNIFVPQTWTLASGYKSKALPPVRDIQKKRDQDLNQIKMPVIGKKNRYYGQVELSRIFTQLEKYSQDIEIAGKTAYHIGGKELAEDTSLLLKGEALAFTKEPIKDIDIRVIVPELCQYNSFVDFLHELFPRATKSDIINDLLLASHSDKETISLSFGDKNSVTCDILFVFKPKRLHLFWSDAIRFSRKENKFVSDLETPLQALSDYYHDVVQTDDPVTINKKGWSKFLIRKTKGAHIPDASLEDKLFIQVINSQKRKELAAEIVDLLTKAGNKASLSYEELLYEGSLILEKRLTPADFKAVWKAAAGKMAAAVAKGIPFHVIHAYLQLSGAKKGDPDLPCLFKTPFKGELDQIFEQPALEDRLGPLLFRHPRPREAWKQIKSKRLAESLFPLLLEQDPLLAHEAMKEFSLPYESRVFPVLLKKGHVHEADELYDKVNDADSLDELTLKMLNQEPSRAVFNRYVARSKGEISTALASAFISLLPFSDLLDLSASLMPLNRSRYVERVGPCLANLGLEKIVSLGEEIKTEGIARYIKRQIENPTPKEWRKSVEYASDDAIEAWLFAILEKVSVNEARLFCLHPKVIAHPKQASFVEAVAKKADLSRKSLYWDILGLCLSYNLKEAVRLIEHSRGNASGLPKPVLKKIEEAKEALIATVENPFPLAECLCDLNIPPLSLLSKAVAYCFHSVPLLKAGWLGNEPFDLETSNYFVGHANFEAFYSLISSRLHSNAPIPARIDKLIEEKRFAFAASITTKSTAPRVLIQLRGQAIKERLDLLKKYGTEEEWEIYLNEPEKKSDDIYNYLLGQPFSSRIKNICLARSVKAWEAYFNYPDELQLEDLKILFRRGLETGKPYPLLRQMKARIGRTESSTEQAWEALEYKEEPYSLERTLSQNPSDSNLRILIPKIYKARPPKVDFSKLEPWLKGAKTELLLEIQLYFEPQKTMADILLQRPDMLLLERLFFGLIEIEEYGFLKEIYIQFDNDYRNKHKRAFLMHSIKDVHSLEFAVREFHEMDPNDKNFESEFIAALFALDSPLPKEWNLFHSIWFKISQAIAAHSKARTELLPPCKYAWENEEELIKGRVPPQMHANLKKMLQDLKPKRAEATHTCKLLLVPIRKALSHKYTHENGDTEIFEHLVKLIPYHHLMTGDLDEALFEYVSLIPSSSESSPRQARLENLLKCLCANEYSTHFPSGMTSLRILIEGSEGVSMELEAMAANRFESKEREQLENQYRSQLLAIFKAHKTLIEQDTFVAYIKAWVLISNFQAGLVKRGEFDWLIKFYQLTLHHLPKYCFSELKEGYYSITLVKGLIQNLTLAGQLAPDSPIMLNLVPLYIEALLKSLEFCPKELKYAFIADIMSNTLLYSNGKIKVIFNKLIDFIEKIIELTFKHSDTLQISMFTNGISETLTEHVKETTLDETDKNRLIGCIGKYRKALIAYTHFQVLNSLIIQWSFHEKTLNFINQD